MKIRSGFVSNSSTASYVIMGIHYDSDEHLKKILYEILGKKPAPLKAKISFQEKKNAVIDYFENTVNKTIDYYKWKCGEMTQESDFERIYKEISDDDEDEVEDDVWELIDDLYGTEWTAETECEEVVGYQLAYSHSDGNSECATLDFDFLKEKMEYLKKISGKTPKLIAYVTGG